MIYILSIIAILTLAFATIAAVSAFKERKKLNMIASCILALLAFIGWGVQVLKELESAKQATRDAEQKTVFERDMRENNEKLLLETQKNSELNQKISDKSDEQAKAQKEIADLYRQLSGKSDKIAILSQEAKATVDGGNSFCYATFANCNVTSNLCFLTVVQKGKYPLYSVQLRIVDLQKYTQLKGDDTYDKFAQAQKIMDIGDIGVGQVHTSLQKQWQLPNTDKQDYNVFISARNGIFTQLIRLRRINGQWLSATRVSAFGAKGEGPILYERVDPNYPRDNKRKVVWEE